MKLTVPKGETYIGGGGEMAVKANKFFDLTKFLLFSYICVSYCNNETELMRMRIDLQELLISGSVKLQNYIYFILMLYKSSYLRDEENRIKC